MATELPLFPLGTVLFPGMILPLHVFEARYRLMFAHRQGVDPVFGVVLTKRGREVGDQPDIHEVGTAASLLKAIRYPDGRYDIAVRGGRRFRVCDGHWDMGYLSGSIEWLPEDDLEGMSAAATAALGERLQRAFGGYLDALEQTASVRIERGDLGADPVAAAYAICALMPFDTTQRQRLLEAPSAAERLDDLMTNLHYERELLLTAGAGGIPIDRPGSRFSMN